MWYVRSADGILCLSAQKETRGKLLFPRTPLAHLRGSVHYLRIINASPQVFLCQIERSIILAIYHLSIKITSRGKGKSAVAAAAYRAGEKIKNEYDGEIHDFTRKGGVVFTEIMLPEQAPVEYANRAVLWNAVEKIEKAKNSQLAREIELALPKELTEEQNISLVREYINRYFVAAGMCADIAIHDEEKGNPHAHVLLTMRPFNEDKSWGDKQKKVYFYDDDGNKIYDKKTRSYKCGKVQTTDWNEQTKAEEWRGAWADLCNDYLERGNHAERIDHRSFIRQGKDEIPTIHLGVAAHQMEKRGIRTERGDINREIEVSNQRLRQLKARLVKLEKWLDEEKNNTEPPTLTDIITNILERREQNGERSRYGAIHNLKAAANILNFLTSNQIFDMVGLAEKLDAMTDKQFEIRDELKKVERRMTTLDEHIRHSGNFKGYRAHKAQYDKLYAKYETAKNTGGFGAERKAQKALDAANEFYEANRPQMVMYEAAETYLRGVLQERFDNKKLPPVSKWQAEREKLTTEKKLLDIEYSKLWHETAAVEKIKRSVDDILREETGTPQRTRRHEHEH